MKSLKFEQDLVPLIIDGSKHSTWRLNDDKDISVNDKIRFINKQTGQVFGVGIIDEVITKRFSDISPQDKELHEQYATSEEMYKAFRKYYGDSVGPDSVVKIVNFHFSEDLDQDNAPQENNMPQIHSADLYADGGSRGNPGPSASGYAILGPNGEVIDKKGYYLGITTNNQAEYQALKYGLEAAKRLKIQEVHVYMDSMLVVNQMKGIFKIRNRDLWPIHEAIQSLVQSFHKVEFTHVPREYNKVADTVVNETLDAAAKQR